LRVDEEPNALSEHTIYRWIEAFKDALKMAPTQESSCEDLPSENLQKCGRISKWKPPIILKIIEEEEVGSL